MRNLASALTWTIVTLLVDGCDRPQDRSPRAATVYAADRCGGPVAGWSLPGSEYGELMAHNSLAVGSAKLTWNGAPISMTTLHSYFETMGQLDPRVNLQVIFENGAACSRVRSMRELIAEQLDCSFQGACVEYSRPAYEMEASRHIVN